MHTNESQCVVLCTTAIIPASRLRIGRRDVDINKHAVLAARRLFRAPSPHQQSEHPFRVPWCDPLHTAAPYTAEAVFCKWEIVVAIPRVVNAPAFWPLIIRAICGRVYNGPRH